MSRSQDQKFFDLFSLVLAALVVFTIAVIALALTISNRTIGESQKRDPQMVASKMMRISPLGRAAVAGESAYTPDALLAATRPAEPEPEAVAAVSSEPKSGDAVYNMACTACHTAGIAGAPKVGDPDAWSARIAQGIDVLYEHAIQGYQGDAGIMPAKGGITSLTDGEVQAAVDLMVAQSQ
ncbi:MAG: cytochrome c5 family protein [Gammaproteobacteria bacterium]